MWLLLIFKEIRAWSQNYLDIGHRQPTYLSHAYRISPEQLSIGKATTWTYIRTLSHSSRKPLSVPRSQVAKNINNLSRWGSKWCSPSANPRPMSPDRPNFHHSAWEAPIATLPRRVAEASHLRIWTVNNWIHKEVGVHGDGIMLLCPNVRFEVISFIIHEILGEDPLPFYSISLIWVGKLFQILSHCSPWIRTFFTNCLNNSAENLWSPLVGNRVASI